MGSATSRGKAFHLTIEDHSEVRKSTDFGDAPIVAHIRANEVSNFALSLDMAMPGVLYEVVEPESGRLKIYMDNDQIFIEVEDINIQLCKQNPAAGNFDGRRRPW